MAVVIVDFGLLVFIWTIQGVVYPSFRRIDEGEFRSWHAAYTRRVGWIVVPLMLAQAGLHAIRLVSDPTVVTGLATTCVLFAWLLTFFGAVPLHGALALEGRSEPRIHALLRVNGWRAIAWTAAFVLSSVRLV